MSKLIRLKNIYLIFVAAFLILIVSNIFVIKELKERTLIYNQMLSMGHPLIEQQSKELEHVKFVNLFAILLSNMLSYIFIVILFVAIIKLVKANNLEHLKELQLEKEKRHLEESQRIEVESLLEGMPDALVICNQKGDITYINLLAEKLLGYTRSELLGQKIERLVPNRFGTNHEKYRDSYFEKSKARPMGMGLELYARHKNGFEIPVEISLSSIENANGKGAIAAIRDVTKRKEIQRLLDESEKRWKYALESGNQGVWDWYVPEKIIYFSHTWKAMLGYQDDEIKNEQSEFESLVHPDDLPKVWHCINDHFENKTDEYHCEVRFLCKDGSYKWVLARGKVLSRDDDGKVLRALGTHTDISSLKEQEAKLKQLAERDALTGLINRPFFVDRLAQAITLAKRHRDNVAILFLDLDDFKQVNDTYGHTTGDLLLCDVANRIKNSVRESDTLARLGGDEFVLLLNEIKDENEFVKIVKKIMGNFSKEFLINDKKLRVTLSIGIALYPRNGEELLIEKADAAMYYVKRNGKNNFKLYNNALKISK